MKTKTTRREGPTARILKLANAAPGGLIRWHEARDEYLNGSEAARADEASAMRHRHKGFNLTSSSGGRHYHMSLSRALDRHFYPVGGTKGYYILKRTIFNDYFSEDKREMESYRATFGADEFGMST